MRFPSSVLRNVGILLNLGPVLLIYGPRYNPVPGNLTVHIRQNSAKQCQNSDNLRNSDTPITAAE